MKDYGINISTRDYEIKAGELVITGDLTNNIYLSLSVRKGVWPFNPSFGSRLHLLQRAKATAHTAADAKDYCIEALKWLLDAGRADSLTVETELDKDKGRLNCLVTVMQNGKKVTYEHFVVVR